MELSILLGFSIMRNESMTLWGKGRVLGVTRGYCVGRFRPIEISYTKDQHIASQTHLRQMDGFPVFGCVRTDRSVNKRYHPRFTKWRFKISR